MVRIGRYGFVRTSAELEKSLEALEIMRINAETELAVVQAPDYDPPFSYEGDEEKKHLVRLDIECAREHLEGIDHDIAIVNDRIHRLKRRNHVA